MSEVGPELKPTASFWPFLPSAGYLSVVAETPYILQSSFLLSKDLGFPFLWYTKVAMARAVVSSDFAGRR